MPVLAEWCLNWGQSVDSPAGISVMMMHESSCAGSRDDNPVKTVLSSIPFSASEGTSILTRTVMLASPDSAPTSIVPSESVSVSWVVPSEKYTPVAQLALVRTVMSMVSCAAPALVTSTGTMADSPGDSCWETPGASTAPGG